jgi:hypothetical protein
MISLEDTQLSAITQVIAKHDTLILS